MGFLSGLKKLFGFGESTTETVGSNFVEFGLVEEVVEETSTVTEPVVVEEVKHVEEQVSVKVEESVQTETTTVKEIKSKSRKSRPVSEDSAPTSEKTRKPYRRPRPKKNKPTE
jgi:hypothetical protein